MCVFLLIERWQSNMQSTIQSQAASQIVSVQSETIMLPPLIREDAIVVADEPILAPNGYEETTTALIDPLAIDVPTVVEESVSVSPGSARTRTVIAHPPVIVPRGMPIGMPMMAGPPPPVIVEEPYAEVAPLPVVPAPPVIAGQMQTVQSVQTVQQAGPGTYRFVDLLVPVRGAPGAPPAPRNTLERLQRRLSLQRVQPAQMQRIRTIVPAGTVYGG